MALGSRGALLCIGVFIILKLVRFNLKFNYKKVFLYISLIFSSILIFLNLNNILMYIYRYLQAFGIDSRSLLLLLENKTYLSGRDNLYEILLREIINKPVFGNGLGGDRRIIGGGVCS